MYRNLYDNVTLEGDVLLIDLDGTLVDSSAAITRAWRAWCRKRNINERDVFRISDGRQSGAVVQQVAPHLDPVAEDRWMVRAQMRDTQGTMQMPGAREFLSRIDASLWAVVTSCPRRLACARLASAGLPEPQLMITAEDVMHSKPEPDGYLLAAERLGVVPERCLVFEDSAAGIESAQRAKMWAIAVVGAVRYAYTNASVAINDWRAIKLLGTRPVMVQVKQGVGGRLVG